MIYKGKSGTHYMYQYIINRTQWGRVLFIFISNSGVLQLNNINFFETLDIALFFCQFFCIFYSYFLVLCDIIVSGGVSYG